MSPGRSGLFTTFLFVSGLLAPRSPIGRQSPWRSQDSGSAAELRGLAVLDAKRAWASGAGGTLLRTRDGERWEKLSVQGGEELDFRDIEGIGRETLVLLSAGPGERSRIYRSRDGGASWTLAHTNPDGDGFYDALAFWDSENGLVLGDPVHGRFVVRATRDGGETWTDLPDTAMPEALPGEGAFAASGTCLFARKGGSEAWFVTGGARVGRVFRTSDRGRTWSVSETPVPAPNASSGLFSVAFLDARRGFAAAGDYKQPAFAGLNGIRTEDGGEHWVASPIAASGFFSAVAAVPGARDALVAAGPPGISRSEDGGRSWKLETATPVNAVALADARTGWAVGPKGTILKLRGTRRP